MYNTFWIQIIFKLYIQNKSVLQSTADTRFYCMQLPKNSIKEDKIMYNEIAVLGKTKII